MYALVAFHAAEAAKPTDLSAPQLRSELPVNQQDTCTILPLAKMIDSPTWSPSLLFKAELYHSLYLLARVFFRVHQKRWIDLHKGHIQKAEQTV